MIIAFLSHLLQLFREANPFVRKDIRNLLLVFFISNTGFYTAIDVLSRNFPDAAGIIYFLGVISGFLLFCAFYNALGHLFDQPYQPNSFIERFRKTGLLLTKSTGFIFVNITALLPVGYFFRKVADSMSERGFISEGTILGDIFLKGVDPLLFGYWVCLWLLFPKLFFNSMPIPCDKRLYTPETIFHLRRITFPIILFFTVANFINKKIDYATKGFFKGAETYEFLGSNALASISTVFMLYAFVLAMMTAYRIAIPESLVTSILDVEQDEIDEIISRRNITYINNTFFIYYSWKSFIFHTVVFFLASLLFFYAINDAYYLFGLPITIFVYMCMLWAGYMYIFTWVNIFLARPWCIIDCEGVSFPSYFSGNLKLSEIKQVTVPGRGLIIECDTPQDIRPTKNLTFHWAAGAKATYAFGISYAWFLKPEILKKLIDYQLGIQKSLGTKGSSCHQKYKAFSLPGASTANAAFHRTKYMGIISGVLIALIAIGSPTWILWKNVEFKLGYKAHQQGDETTAYRHFLRAAKLGDFDATRNVAWMLDTATGVEPSQKEVFYWHSKVADYPLPMRNIASEGYRSTSNTIAMARIIVGEMYEHGLGTHKDLREAFDYYYRAGNKISLTQETKQKINALTFKLVSLTERILQDDGDLEEAKGRAKRASYRLEKLKDDQPGLADAWERLGDILYKAKDFDRAVNFWRTALSKTNDTTMKQRLLNKLASTEASQ